ncbi:16S rRNA (cytosine(1402)-N(4))-methyltransferase [bacterium]|nr:MAG: 16S rRNA (cytosine(1402)-N(4))-methyltransferase [bacterium]
MLQHIPVLLKEVTEYLDPSPGKKFIDATVGGGGHAKELIKNGAAVLGIDRDSSVIASISDLSLRGVTPATGRRGNPKDDEIASLTLAMTEKKKGARNDELRVVQGNFADLKKIAEANGFAEVDGILFDLGLGSHQLDDPKRGFSFQKTGPLDMRYDIGSPSTSSGNILLPERSRAGRGGVEGLTAARIVNSYSEKELIRIFYQYGEERRFGKRIARAILEARKTGEIATTSQLFDLIKKTLPGKFRFKAGDTARRIFQALRIEVNGELKNLEKALPQALQLLKKGGRLVVISFHSLEDRIVKNFFLREAKDCVCPPEFPVCVCGKKPNVRVLTKKPAMAAAEEAEMNSRARSAKLRAAEKF